LLNNVPKNNHSPIPLMNIVFHTGKSSLTLGSSADQPAANVVVPSTTTAHLAHSAATAGPMICPATTGPGSQPSAATTGTIIRSHSTTGLVVSLADASGPVSVEQSPVTVTTSSPIVVLAAATGLVNQPVSTGITTQLDATSGPMVYQTAATGITIVDRITSDSIVQLDTTTTTTDQPSATAGSTLQPDASTKSTVRLATTCRQLPASTKRCKSVRKSTVHKLKCRKRKVDNELCGDCGFMYGDADDPLLGDSWETCFTCQKWFHEFCGESVNKHFVVMIVGTTNAHSLLCFCL